MPGEAEKAAALMNLSLVEFVARFCIFDWWVGDGRDIKVISPIKYFDDNELDRLIRLLPDERDKPGSVASFGFPLRRGTCVFLKDDLCSIHAAKPFECKDAFGCKNPNGRNSREDIAKAWEPLQDQIDKLLDEVQEFKKCKQP